MSVSRAGITPFNPVSKGNNILVVGCYGYIFRIYLYMYYNSTTTLFQNSHRNLGIKWQFRLNLENLNVDNFGPENYVFLIFRNHSFGSIEQKL